MEYCRHCGSELAENGRFCHACGSALDPAAAPARASEYREVVIRLDMSMKHLQHLWNRDRRPNSYAGRFWPRVWQECQPRIGAEISRLAAEGWELSETTIGPENLVYHEQDESLGAKTLRTVLWLSIVGIPLVFLMADQSWHHIDSARLHFRRTA